MDQADPSSRLLVHTVNLDLSYRMIFSAAQTTIHVELHLSFALFFAFAFALSFLNRSSTVASFRILDDPLGLWRLPLLQLFLPCCTSLTVLLSPLARVVLAALGL